MTAGRGTNGGLVLRGTVTFLPGTRSDVTLLRPQKGRIMLDWLWNPNGESGGKGDCGMTAALETRFPVPGGMGSRLFSASGAERFML